MYHNGCVSFKKVQAFCINHAKVVYEEICSLGGTQIMFSDLQKRYCEGDEDVIKQQSRTINKEECCENIFLIEPTQNKAIRPNLHK